MRNNIIIILFYLIVLIKTDSISEDQCREIKPFEDVIEDCTRYTISNNNKVCCYMEIYYDEGESYLCYPVEKDIDAIKKEIEMLEDIYENSDSISIDCDSSFINLSIAFLSSLILFF